MKGYKLFSVRKGKLTSLFGICGHTGGISYELVYEPHKKTYRKINCGGIAVFDDLNDVIDYYRHIKWYKSENMLYEVEYKPSKHDLFVYINNRIYTLSLNVPFGTGYADWIIPIKKIEVE